MFPRLRLLLTVLAVLVLAACGAPAAQQEPTAAPPTEVPPTAVPPTEVPPTAVPPTEVPPTAVPPTPVAAREDMTAYTGEDFTMFLPKGWEAIEVSGSDREEMLAEMRRRLPELADKLPSDMNLDNIMLWVFNTNSQDPLFVDNMNMQKIPAEGILEVQFRLGLDEIMKTLDGAGLTVVNSDRNLTINGLPAMHIQYEIAVPGVDGQTVAVGVYQYLLMEEDAIRIITYSISQSVEEEYEPLIRDSIESYQLTS